MVTPEQSSLLTGLVKAPVGMFTSSVLQSSFQCLPASSSSIENE